MWIEPLFFLHAENVTVNKVRTDQGKQGENLVFQHSQGKSWKIRELFLKSGKNWFDKESQGKTIFILVKLCQII